MLTGCELLLPLATAPKLTLVGLALILACAPVPLNATPAVAVELLALALIAMFPVEVLAAVGAKCAWKVVADPAASE